MADPPPTLTDDVGAAIDGEPAALGGEFLRHVLGDLAEHAGHAARELAGDPVGHRRGRSAGHDQHPAGQSGGVELVGHPVGAARAEGDPARQRVVGEGQHVGSLADAGRSLASGR